MIKIAKLREDQRDLLFREASRVGGISEFIIEKDFWVCFLLDIIFTKEEFESIIIFKGGTSLSKCFKAIDRFSEDIDLVLDWSTLGYENDEPWYERSNTAQAKYESKMNHQASNFLEESFIGLISKKLDSLGLKKYKLYLDDSDSTGLTVLFEYPNIYDSLYIKPIIKLEFGPVASISPSEDIQIIPYVKEFLGKDLPEMNIKVRTIKAKRTFFEKATILHAEANRNNEKYPVRYSRHYYDLYMLSKTDIYLDAKKDISLLRDVIAFKKQFYRKTSAKYEEILDANLKLVPSIEGIKAFKADYNAMKEMIFGLIPEFDEIITHLKNVENELNTAILNLRNSDDE